MYRLAEERITKLVHAGLASRLRTGKRGIEKESLRIRRDGSIAQTPHPAAWGSALTHPYVTTDYSEALTEFITPAFDRTDDVMRFLHEVHQFTYEMLSTDELLWASSMPCALKDDRTLPIAEYGTSNIGRMKHVYPRVIRLTSTVAEPLDLDDLVSHHFPLAQADAAFALNAAYEDSVLKVVIDVS